RCRGAVSPPPWSGRAEGGSGCHTQAFCCGMHPRAPPSGAGAETRGFNRAYTRRFGLLDEQHLGSELSLGEVRVLYELAHQERSTAAALARTLELDPGHLSRMLGGLRRSGLVRRSPSPADRRASILAP